MYMLNKKELRKSPKTKKEIENCPQEVKVQLYKCLRQRAVH